MPPYLNKREKGQDKTMQATKDSMIFKYHNAEKYWDIVELIRIKGRFDSQHIKRKKFIQPCEQLEPLILTFQTLR